jgi:hypothetical protein
MGLPNAGVDTVKMVAYAAEVAGRAQGVGLSPSLVAAAQKTALDASASRILEATRALLAKFVVRATTEHLEHRITVGRGRGVDRGFDAAVSNVSEMLRRSLPDRNTTSDGYRQVFATGTIDGFVSPTIRQDPELAATLTAAIERSGSAAKTDLLAMLAPLRPVVDSAAAALGTGEESVSAQWKDELDGRARLVEVLWTEKRAVETALGRSGRGLARFVFFDYFGPTTDARDTEPPPAPTS